MHAFPNERHQSGRLCTISSTSLASDLAGMRPWVHPAGSPPPPPRPSECTDNAGEKDGGRSDKPVQGHSSTHTKRGTARRQQGSSKAGRVRMGGGRGGGTGRRRAAPAGRPASRSPSQAGRRARVFVALHRWLSGEGDRRFMWRQGGRRNGGRWRSRVRPVNFLHDALPHLIDESRNRLVREITAMLTFDEVVPIHLVCERLRELRGCGRNPGARHQSGGAPD